MDHWEDGAFQILFIEHFLYVGAAADLEDTLVSKRCCLGVCTVQFNTKEEGQESSKYTVMSDFAKHYEEE